MFKILVDGVWCGPWDEKECDYITIGSAADATCAWSGRPTST